MIVELKHEYSPFRETLEEHGEVIEVEITLRGGKRYMLRDNDGQLETECLDGLSRVPMILLKTPAFVPPSLPREIRPLRDNE